MEFLSRSIWISGKDWLLSKTLTVKDLKEELNFVSEDAQVFCRDLGHGYQLFFLSEELKEVARIFIRRIEVTSVAGE